MLVIAVRARARDGLGEGIYHVEGVETLCERNASSESVEDTRCYYNLQWVCEHFSEALCACGAVVYHSYGLAVDRTKRDGLVFWRLKCNENYLD